MYIYPNKNVKPKLAIKTIVRMDELGIEYSQDLLEVTH